MPKSKKLVDNIIELVDIKSRGFKSPVDFFNKLREYDYSRLELMIIDSAIKKMPMGRLHNTLLLSEEKFLTMVENIIEKLTSFKH